MKLFVLGATGHTGTHIVDIALSRSHDVTAFVRSPQKITRRDPRLKVVAGNPLDVDQLAKQIVGHDAVLSALGVRPPQAFRAHSLVGECPASTTAAMTRTGVNRIVLVSAAVLFPEKGIAFAFFRWLLQHISRDLKTAEDIVRSAQFDWTIVRPPRLTNGDPILHIASRQRRCLPRATWHRFEQSRILCSTAWSRGVTSANWSV
jgi:putative NADH-flavin reductase